MLTVFRRHQQILMLVIAILTIIAFIWLYNPTDKFNKFGGNDVASIYGKVVQRAEIDRQVRGYQLALALGLTDFVRDLGGMGANEETSLSDFILNLFVIRHEAPVLGIRPSDEAVAGVIKSLPVLQTDGTFDPTKYASFLQDQLAPRGYTERQMEEMIRDSLRVKEIRKIVTSPVAVGEGQVREAARIYQPVSGQMLRFDREAFLKGAAPAQEEIAAFYEKNKAGMRAPETRAITYAVLDLPPAQQKLEGKELTAALQKLADRIVASGKSIREGVGKGGDFEQLAAKQGLTVRKDAVVDRTGNQTGKTAVAVPEEVTAGAFRLPKAGSVSDIIQSGRSFYLVTVKGITPECQLELAEVADRIAALIGAEKAAKAAAAAATKAIEQIRSSMESGKSFADAAKQAGVKTQAFSQINPSDRRGTPEQQAFAAATLSLKEGELGTLQPAPWGVFAAYLDKRAPLTDAQWNERRESLSKTLLTNEQELLFLEWLRSARAAAQIKMLAGNGGRGA
jgi:hypothetical protein